MFAQAIILTAQKLGRALGVIKCRNGILQRAHRAVVNLLKVRFAPIYLGRGDVERQSPSGYPEGVEPGVGRVQTLLDCLALQHHFCQFRHGVAVNFLNPLMVGIRVYIRQHGIGANPMQEAPLPSPRGPVINSPPAGDAGLIIDPAILQMSPGRVGSGGGHVGLAIGKVDR